MTERRRHPFVKVRVPRAQLELAQLRLWELGASGLEERDATTLVPGPVEGSPVVLASFPDDAAARHALQAIRDDYEADLVYVDHQDWATEWRHGFSAQRIGRRLLLRPSWEEVAGTPDDVIVTIDPENAFGSGDHETTRLVLEVLERRLAGGERVLDVGCGSGILSIAAVLLGASTADAIDVEHDAVITARRNAALNGVAPRVHASTRPLSDVTGGYDVVLGNIETRALVPMADDLQARVAPGGFLALSGVLRSERETLLSAYASMRVDEALEQGEWCAFVLAPGGL